MWRRCFFDVCGFCVAWRFFNEHHVFWSNSCLNSIVFLLFCALAIKYGYFSPRKVALFWWVISQSDSGAMVLWFWHVKAVLSFAPRFGHICAKVFSQRHQKISVFQRFPDGFVDV